MKKPQVAPVHVRLAPETLDTLRTVAERRAATVHSLVVEAVQALIAREGEEPEIRALKLAFGAMADQFAWLGAPSEGDHKKLLLTLVRTGADELLAGLGGDDAQKADPRTTMAHAGARKVLQHMARERATGAAADLFPEQAALAEAGRILGVKKETKQ